MRSLLLLPLLVFGCAPDEPPDDSQPPVYDTGAGQHPAEPCAAMWYPDQDEDGFGALQPGLPGCIGPLGWVGVSGDCDDQDPERGPHADERCNGLDDDCDGLIDEDFPEAQASWFPDQDGDGWGDQADERLLCGGEQGLVQQPGDCDDRRPSINPAAREPCNHRDDDCDGLVDEGCEGRCRDGVKGGAHEACDGGDDRACPDACSAHCACPSAEPGLLRVHMVDVGQGDALVVISPDGFVLLVDAGPSGACDELDWYLDSQGIDSIDYALVSHQHADHLGSMDTLLQLHPEVVLAFDNDGTFSTGSDLDYRRAAFGRHAGLQEGSRIDMGPLLTVDVLHADRGASNENDNSVVLLLQHGQLRLLLGGDCEASCEAGLDSGPVDIYKVHHHGAADASSQAFLDATMPQLALISVGLGNSYSHPASSTLRSLEDIGAVVLRTDLDGSVLIESDGVTFETGGVSFTPSSSLTQE